MIDPCSLFDLTGKTALITGSNRGLGNYFAEGLLRAGANVVMHGRDKKKVNQAAAEMTQRVGKEVATCVFDVTDANAVHRELDRLVEERGVPDILVNNAGIQERHPIHEFPAEQFAKVIETNLISAFNVSQPLAAHMVKQGRGKIIMIGSVQSKLARQTIAPYSAAKGGLALLAQGMAADLARHNIQVNVLSPGYFQTQMNQALVEDKKFSAWLCQRTPAQRWGQPEELIGTLVYLASDASSFVNGQNIVVDGGITSIV
ncbi:MAG: SDR family oxidoreductase [Actinomycetaceae bacterium]|nr:SDR family oxidoreductase [Actinomycetaceae bacterium]